MLQRRPALHFPRVTWELFLFSSAEQLCGRQDVDTKHKVGNSEHQGERWRVRIMGERRVCSSAAALIR